ncbi:glycosyltransferase family 4 protein [Limnobacter humi]|uniref:Glycosyltransferase family 4 protein n=1 Tax=Limnobacter humi TaxID=1778671 RepID=A0ABT1WL44_9BURK|nr:glycosyltransferase family 1 protein [Limnobacter humi]MCQ8897802.1 glycosyltransferase family 4 protein [Limnobacter humi]
MKKILIDARWLTNSMRGIGVFTKNLIYALIENDHDKFEFHLAVRKKFVSLLANKLPKNFYVVQLPDWCPDPILDLVVFNYLTKKLSADVVHFTGNTGFVLPRLAAHVLLTLHDVSFLKSADVVPFPNQNLRQAIGRIYRKVFVPFYAKSATKVCTVSEFAVKDIQHELGIAAEFIYHGFELAIDTSVSDNDIAATEHNRIDSTKYLAITGPDPQKNLTFVISAFISLYQKYKSEAPKLAVIGVNRQQYQRLKPGGLITENISFLGMCPHRDIPKYIQSCKTMIVPSFYESFGLPVIESLFFHKAPLCSSGGALPEIGASFAHYFDPRNQGTLVKLIESIEMGNLLIDLPAEQVGHHLSRFSWSIVANFYLSQYAAKNVAQDRETPCS